MSDPSISNLPPAVAIHAAAAIGAVLLGPVALWARKRSRGHRAAGYAWITLMLVTALSALFIRHPSHGVLGFSWIHLLIVVSVAGIARGVWYIAQGRVLAHRQTMQAVYVGACLLAGTFTLLPGRLLGDLLWHDLLGWV